MNSYDTMNPNYGYNRNNQGWQQPSYSNPGYRVQPQQPFNSNIMYVTSPEEALIKTEIRNSDMVYFDQDKNVFYRVRVDVDGRKSWTSFTYSLPNQDENAPATKADIQMLSERIAELEKAREPKVAPKKKKPEQEVIDHGESDV